MTVKHMQRIDKFLSDAGIASRSEIKKILRSGSVSVNGKKISDPSQKIDETIDIVEYNGQTVERLRRVVLLLNKPDGYVTSTDDPRDRTVMELIPQKYQTWHVAPVGRLDKQTEGLLLFTNDGTLAHRLISPKYEIEKEYFARHEGFASQDDIAAFRNALTLKDGTICRPAQLIPINPGESRIIVTEGKYHQVRRMMASRDLPVTYLRREREGALTLDGVAVGEFRELSDDEIRALMDSVQFEQTNDLTKN